jgi:hypothetical protein
MTFWVERDHAKAEFEKVMKVDARKAYDGNLLPPPPMRSLLPDLRFDEETIFRELGLGADEEKNSNPVTVTDNKNLNRKNPFNNGGKTK